MIVFGKRDRATDPRDLLGDVAARLRAAAAGRDRTRHEALAAALIAAGMLMQGLADAAFSETGADAPAPDQDAATALMLALAEAVDASWASGFHGPVTDGEPAMSTLAALALPARITARWCEGFAFYATYPETYAMAARRSGLGPETLVIGIRSIGAPLAAMVAAGLGSRRIITVRPVGHPFGRELALSEALAAEIRAWTGPVAVVDEGPGLSGSSFGAVLDALDRLGVAEERIALFPSHDGAPGAQAGAAQRRRWDRMRRHIVSADAVIGAPEQGLAAWVSEGAGAALEEVSGGAWRRHLYADTADWPPVNAWQERRKFLWRRDNRTWYLKFAGLGAPAEAKLARARTLSAAGFIPAVVGLRHGFLVERWHGAAMPLQAADGSAWLERIGDYLGYRARTFPAGAQNGAENGADLPALMAMTRHNVLTALGKPAAATLDRWTPRRLAALERSVRRVEIDNRMQPWKWLALPDGRLLKADALDHAAGHDLVGCQDIAWDVVGAAEEFGLSENARVYLTGRVEVAGDRAIDPELIACLTPCYLAFQVGALTLALGATGDPAETVRLRRRLDTMTERLCRVLAQP